MTTNGRQSYSQNEIRSMQARYKNILNEISLHDRLYYKESNPKISDFEYDCLKAEAERLENLLSQYSNEVSQTKIGDDRLENFQSFKHITPMLSLANTYSRDELEQFDNRVRAQLGNKQFSYIIEPKIDGVAVNLIYKHGQFFKALSRGNGIAGDDVSSNVKTVENFPININNDDNEIEIRGEVYIDEKTFISINRIREEEGLEIFANPRNLAAGTLKTLDPKEVDDRHLRLITYAIGHKTQDCIQTQAETLEYLKILGFQSQERYWHAKNISEACDCITELNEARTAFKYWTDGAVLKINELNLHNELGSTAKSPKWAIAYKFAPERKTTKLLNIALQVGRTGVVTPVAELEQVQLSGTNVSRATLHNADEIAKKDIRIGDYVVIEKAGEIIPAIICVEMSKRSQDLKKFIFPSKCPACGAKLVRLDGEAAWRCQNSCCKPQVCRRIEHFVSRTAMDIDGLGESLIQKLIDNKTLNNISDIYSLKFDDLENLEKFGVKSALKILDNIDKSKNNPLWRLLHGLGIHGIGEQTAKDIAKHFSSIDKLKSATHEQLETIDGIGAKLSSSITTFFTEPHNVEILGKLKNEGVTCETSDPHAHNSKNINFSGKIFALTGSLQTMKRHEAAANIEQFGGRITNFISKNTDVLISGEDSGSKLEKAKSLGITIWAEKQFLEKLEG